MFRNWFKRVFQPKSSSGTRGRRRPTAARLDVEPLETRLVPAVTAALSQGVLTLIGDAGDNVVDARDRGNGTVEVATGERDDAGNIVIVSSSTFEGVSKVQADMGAGDDIFQYLYTGNVMATDLDVTLGRGTDFALVGEPVPTGVLSEASGLRIDIKAGDEHNQEDPDTITNFMGVVVPIVSGDVRINLTGTDLQVFPSGLGGFEQFFVVIPVVAAGGEASVRVDGRGGFDHVVENSSLVNGTLNLKIDGGDGFDHVTTSVFFVNEELTIEGGNFVTGNGTVDVKLDGGAGDDFLDTEIGTNFDRLTNPLDGTVHVKADGGDGNDQVIASIFGDLNGTADLKLDGGNGNDQVIAEIGTFPIFGIHTTLNGTVNVRADGGDGNDTVLGIVQTTGGTAPPGSSSARLRGGDGADLVAYVQDNSTGQVQAHLHGGDGDDTAAAVLLSGQPPT